MSQSSTQGAPAQTMVCTRLCATALTISLSSLLLVAESAFISNSAKLMHNAFQIPLPSGHVATLPRRISTCLAGPRNRLNSRLPASLSTSMSDATPQEPPKPLDKYKLEPVGSSLPKLDSPKVAFPDLTPERFRHPFDTRATRALQRLFPFEFVIRQGLGTVVEQAMFLDNLSTAVRVGPNQLPKIYNSLQEALEILNLDIPVDVYVKQNPVPNAYTMAMQGKKPFIVIHSSLIELMTEAELQAVIAHELGHLKCEHGVWVTAANILSVFASQIPGVGRAASEALQSSIMRWLQSAELSCDRASLLVAQDARVVVSVIMKLTGGAASYSDQLNPDAFLRQAREFEQESTSSWVGRQMRSQMATMLTHPLPVVRARELDIYARSPAYRQLVQKGAPLPSAQAQAPPTPGEAVA